jgi:hypothetical protein
MFEWIAGFPLSVPGARMNKNGAIRSVICGIWMALGMVRVLSATSVYLTDVPDYSWWAGCFGTASGNLMGFWDRHGFPDFYTGPTSDGLAPLNSFGDNAGIISLWASQAGVDGRPSDQFGHFDDYYAAYESTDPDPYIVAGRPEHAPDCLGDFLGLSQWKWADMANECDGNIDAFSFVYWAASGEKRINFQPESVAGVPVCDLQSGLRSWTQYRGYDSAVFTQLADFNPHTPAGKGFTFEELKAEIDAGYPVLLFLQKPDEMSRSLGGQPRVNPEIHGMLAYGYVLNDDGAAYVRYRTSWASGDNRFSSWSAEPWEAGLPLRGVIGYHPRPRLRQSLLSEGSLTLQWDGPAAELFDSSQDGTRLVHGYVVEMARSLQTPDFVPVSPVVLEHFYTLTNCPSLAYFRIKLVTL